MTVALAPKNRPAALAKANAARARQLAENKALGLRKDFLDAPEWERLARERGVRLPAWTTPCAPGRMETWLKRLGLTVTQHAEWFGSPGLAAFPRKNPDWPLRAWVGLMLELTDSLPTNRTPHKPTHQATGGAPNVTSKPKTRGSPIPNIAAIHKPLVRMSA